MKVKVLCVCKLRIMIDQRKSVVCHDTSHAHRHHHRFVESTHSASNSEWDADKAWSSQEWKSDEMMDDRTVKPVVCPQRGAQHFVIEDDETESELSLGSRSFLNGVNDQERKKQKRSSFCDMVNVHVCNIGISVIHGQESLRQMAFHQEHKRSHNETNVRHICEFGVRTR